MIITKFLEHTAHGWKQAEPPPPSFPLAQMVAFLTEQLELSERAGRVSLGGPYRVVFTKTDSGFTLTVEERTFAEIREVDESDRLTQWVLQDAVPEKPEKPES